jgi:hypothetical protein
MQSTVPATGVGLTQDALAHLCRIRQRRIAWAETDRLKLRPDEIEKIRAAIRKRCWWTRPPHTGRLLSDRSFRQVVEREDYFDCDSAARAWTIHGIITSRNITGSGQTPFCRPRWPPWGFIQAVLGKSPALSRR